MIELDENIITAISIINKNSKLIKRAENVLKDFVNEPHCFLYLKLPNGKKIKIEQGFSLEYYILTEMEEEG